MKNTTHRVVILNNVNSDVIAQAILILKDGAQPADSNIMIEAERIVEGYMGRKCKSELQKRTQNRATVLSAAAAVIGLAAAAIMYFV